MKNLRATLHAYRKAHHYLILRKAKGRYHHARERRQQTKH